MLSFVYQTKGKTYKSTTPTQGFGYEKEDDALQRAHMNVEYLKGELKKK